MQNLGQQLKYIRETYDLRQSDLAKLLGVSKSSISHYEANNWAIPIKHLITFSDYLNLSVDYILGLTKIKNYENIIKGLNLNKMAENVTIICKDNNLSNIALANILNTGEATIRDYKKAKYPILTTFALELTNKFNYSIDWLFGRTNEKYIISKRS